MEVTRDTRQAAGEGAGRAEARPEDDARHAASDARHVVGGDTRRATRDMSHAACRVSSLGDASRPMKPSGIPWLGDVPEEWGIAPLYKLVSQVRALNDGVKEKNLLSLSYGRIIRKDIETAAGLVPESYAGYNRIEPNDIVLRLTDLQNDQKSLRVGLSHERGIVTSAYLTIRPGDESSTDYLAYAIKLFDFKKGFYGIGSGVRQSLKFGEVKKIAMPFPPLSEQRLIARFLDGVGARIDGLKAKMASEIERLEAYKRSFIAEAVAGRWSAGNDTRRAAGDTRDGRATREMDARHATRESRMPKCRRACRMTHAACQAPAAQAAP